MDSDTLKPGDLVGVNKDSYLILDTLPAEYDSRVKAMEVDEKPTEDYSDIGERACRAVQSREVMLHRHQRKVAYPCVTPLENADGLAHRGRLALSKIRGPAMVRHPTEEYAMVSSACLLEWAGPQG